MRQYHNQKKFWRVTECRTYSRPRLISLEAVAYIKEKKRGIDIYSKCNEKGKRGKGDGVKGADLFTEWLQRHPCATTTSSARWMRSAWKSTSKRADLILLWLA